MLHGTNEGVLVPRGLIQDDGDGVVIPEFEDAFVATEKMCAGGSCTLPASQHLQIRVIWIIVNVSNIM